MHARFVTNISELSAAEWNRLEGTTCPFLRHEFLAALERCECVGEASGWLPCHVVLTDDSGQLLAAMPLYERDDSWGEFVFDWAWADAYSRAGLDYYPKLVSAIPFTPATGRRCLTAPGADRHLLSRALLDAALGYADDRDLSSVHVLFPAKDELGVLEGAPFLIRTDCQFHWHNSDYGDFDDFLATLKSTKRKKTRRERRRVREAGIRFERRSGAEMTDMLWQDILPLYAGTFWRRGREPYLNQRFFREIASLLPDNLLIIIALFDGSPVGTAICFRDDRTLYGRYWGASGRYHSLHFETCYYQGIEYCIEQNLRVFEPGTQGEHKIARGFVPTTTYSAHWLADPRFARAVDDYLADERRHIERYMQVAGEHVPYRHER